MGTATTSLESEFSTGTLSRMALMPDEIDAQWEEAFDGVLGFRRLKANWDYDGAKAPNPELVDSALDLLNSLRSERPLPPPSHFSLTGDGVIIIEWIQSGWTLVLEIKEPYRGEWMHRIGNNRPLFGTSEWPSRRRTSETRVAQVA